MSTRSERDARAGLGPEDYPATTAIPPLEDLGGMEVRDVNGEKVGKVEDAYVDADTSYVRYLAVSTGWFGTKRHMVPVDDVRMERGEGDDYLVVPYDKDHMRDAPSFERDEAFSREQEYRTYGHYGRTGYWDALRARQSTPAATPEIAEREERTGDELKARQTTPAPTPEIAQAEIDAAIARGEDPNQVAVKRWGV
jgi:sporulation protein YlmC with PRC-barrel domain